MLQYLPMSTTYPRFLLPTDSNFSTLREVYSGIFVGGARSPYVMSGIVEYCIALHPLDEEDIPFRLNQSFNFKRFISAPIEDGVEVPEDVLEMSWQMYRKYGSILIHCKAGLSRSATVAYAILLKSGFSNSEALRMVKIKKNYPFENMIIGATEWAFKQTY